MKSIEGIDVKNKKVIVRVDYNVPISDKQVADDTKIIASLKTIKYLIDNNAKVILLSHLGRVESEQDKIDNTLEPVAVHLSKLIETNVYFIPKSTGTQIEHIIETMDYGEILLIENTRHEDYPKKLESSCDEALSKFWASLGDIFVLDAFGSAHRNHSSTYGISKYIPSYAGFLVFKEKEMLDKIINEQSTLIMGGSKISDKIKIIERLIQKTDRLLVGGGMCFTFLKAKGYNIGKSIVDESLIECTTKILNNYEDKIVLPVDVVTKDVVKNIESIEENDVCYDIGPKTVELFINNLKDSKLILWNGPLGKYEEDDYEFGTRKILQFLYDNKLEETVIAGGDIIAASKKCEYTFKNVCTGGGATLEYLEKSDFKTFTRLNGESGEKDNIK